MIALRHALLALALAGAFLASAAPAHASHYALADVPTMVNADQTGKLAKAGVTTTEQLLDKAAKAKDRKKLAKSSGLPVADLTTLARRCDLLRLAGVGPEMVLLFEAAGVHTAAELGHQDAAALEAAVLKANQAHTPRLTEKPPATEQLAHWIAEAKKLPAVLEGK